MLTVFLPLPMCAFYGVNALSDHSKQPGAAFGASPKATIVDDGVVTFEL